MKQRIVPEARIRVLQLHLSILDIWCFRQLNKSGFLCVLSVQNFIVATATINHTAYIYDHCCEMASTICIR